MFRMTVIFSFMFLVLVLLLAGGCAATHEFDDRLGEITRPYKFSITGWEMATLPQEIGDWFQPELSPDEGVDTVRRYFTNAARLSTLEAELVAVAGGDRPGEAPQLADGLDTLRKEKDGLEPQVEKVLAEQIRQTLARHGIYNPLLPVKVTFPPVNFSLEPPPHLLVVSPRESINSIREVRLEQAMTLQTMESIEAAVDELGVSSLVVELGGFGGTFPTFVAESSSLQYTIESAVEEWLHQYLAFTPLGFAYLLDATGVSPNYEIATMNETVVGIVSEEITAEVYDLYYDGKERGSGGDEHDEYYREMRQIRLRVDEQLAAGAVAEAESYMEERRLYLLEMGYYIRKLNQAYFAFHGMYADSPASVDPIGVELKELRARSQSVKDFLETVSPMTSRADLQRSLK